MLIHIMITQKEKALKQGSLLHSDGITDYLPAKPAGRGNSSTTGKQKKETKD